MPATPSNRPKTVNLVESLATVTATLDRGSALTHSPDAPASSTSVHEAVAAVASAVEALERRTDAGQKSVDLQFHLGTERLDLRVELKDGTVHTTFRTDSSELRTALTHEWQAVVQPASGRELRLADPVFSSSAGTAGDAAQGSLGQGTPQQRGQNDPASAAFMLHPGAGEEDAPESTPATIVAPLSTSLLNAVA